MTRIGIIRHGTTEWNKLGKAQGNTDIPLDSDGLNEAEKLAERLGNEKWDIIYSSPLSRAKQTAETIAKQFENIEVRFDDRLREVSGGKIEGTTEDERIAKWGTNWRELDLEMEQVESIVERGLSVIDELTKNHPKESIIIVSHGALIKNLLTLLLPENSVIDKVNNTSLTTLRKTADGWDIELYNCTLHLEKDFPNLRRL